MKLSKNKIDFLGTSTSLLCAIHCALLPFVLSSGLIGTHSFLAHPLFEFGVVIATLIFVYMSIWKPFIKDKSNKVPFILSLIGLILVLAHHSVAAFSTAIIVMGGILIATAHIYNLLSASHSHNRP